MRVRKRHYVVYKELEWIQGLLINPRARLYGWCFLCCQRHRPHDQDWVTNNPDDVTCKVCRRMIAKERK